MERESFEDPLTARVMNERFVSVKVDREERPDVDSIYMDAVVALTGSGRLADDGVPDARGRAVLRRHLLPARAAPRAAGVQAGAARRRRGLERRGAARWPSRARTWPSTSAPGRFCSRRPTRSTPALLAEADRNLDGGFDETWGGWGRAPKFPPASVLEFLLRRGDVERVRKTLDGMAAGGMYDLVGGGFHRYSVDARWLVPHFEKMLYDNALLASVYLHAAQRFGDERYRRVADATLDYLERELALEGGGFASAQDADTDGVEGLTFTWAPGEGAPDELLQPFEDGRFVLRGELDEEHARTALRAARAARRSRYATTRRSRRGTAWRWPRSPRPGALETATRAGRVPARPALDARRPPPPDVARRPSRREPATSRTTPTSPTG